MVDPDVRSRQLAAESLRAGSPTAWFDRLYAEAGRGEVAVPWDRGAAHPVLVDWCDEREPGPDAGPAVVVGCGRGSDAELLAGRGVVTTAFDVSPVAVEQARERHPGSHVDYVVADLLALPERWPAGFGLVVEIMTVQSLPRDVRRAAVAAIGSLVAPGGTLLVIGMVPVDQPQPGPPWPLDRAEMASFADGRLALVSLDVLPGAGGAERWRGEYLASR